MRHSPRDTAITVSRHLAVDIKAVDLLTLAGVAGFVFLAMCLYRSQQTPRASAVLIGLGGLATMVTSQGPIPALVMASAVIWLVGQAWLALSLSRIDRTPSQPAPTVEQTITYTHAESRPRGGAHPM